MIADLTYALVLFVHPSPEPRVYASFPTAEACRTERATVARDLEGTQITVTCIPQNQLQFNSMTSQMQSIMSTLRSMHEKIPGAENF